MVNYVGVTLAEGWFLENPLWDILSATSCGEAVFMIEMAYKEALAKWQGQFDGH